MIDMDKKQIQGQMSIFDFIPEPDPVDEWALPCDTCRFDVHGCCDYNMPLGDFCRLGDKWQPKEEKIHPVDIMGICDDAYCPECHSSLDETKWMDCERCPWCGIRIDWRPWHRMNDPEEDNEDPG